MKRKVDYFQEAVNLYSNIEINDAGLTDIISFIHMDLTVEEIREYLKFIKVGTFGLKLKEISDLKKQRPEMSWKMMAAGMGQELYEWKRLLKLRKELFEVWKRDKPYIPDRDT